MRNLIIVCEDKYRSFGDYLSQLISLEDDTAEATVGVKDGTVAAQVWNEKEYNANAAQISSNQYILFIGNSKHIKDKAAHMEVKFDKYGMKYGWLGKQGMLCVDENVSVKEYNDFFEFAKEYCKSIEKLIDRNKKPNNAANVAMVGGVAGLVALVGTLGAAIPLAGYFSLKKLKQNNKITAQQYSCNVMKFYLDDLNNFLGL
ncbi:MAG: hypothetical protein MRZ66_02500 [Clostridiales bacterium]|jgi:hypothetical protein|nr:hypothetical protein [Clostridiales bacterium]